MFIRVKRLILERKNIKTVNKFKVITVLDYEDGKVTQYNIDKWDIYSESIESFLSTQGHRISDCHWMVHEDATIYRK